MIHSLRVLLIRCFYFECCNLQAFPLSILQLLLYIRYYTSSSSTGALGGPSVRVHGQRFEGVIERHQDLATSAYPSGVR